MCTPATIAMTTLSTATSLMGIKSKNKALTSQAQQMALAGAQQAQMDLDVLETRRAQEGTRITLEQLRRIRQGTRERGTLQTRLADAGVAGGSTLRDVITSVIQEDQDLGSLETGRDWMDEQITLEQRGALARGQSQINQAQGLLSQRTSGVSGVLQLIGAGVSGYAQGQMLEPKGKNTNGKTTKKSD